MDTLTPSHHVNIIVTCTKRKHVRFESDLRFRDVDAPDPSSGLTCWLKRLSNSSAEVVPAKLLYSGDHWSTVKTLECVASTAGLTADIWICSAGYGLLDMDSKIRSYSATFAADDPDAVSRWSETSSTQDQNQDWWRLLTSWKSPASPSPRSIAQVAASHPESPMLVVASQLYLGAILEDVKCAARTLSDPDLLCVISAGTDNLPTLEANLLPANAALQKDLGGSLGSLNIRLARAILSEFAYGQLRASHLNMHFSQKLAQAPPTPVYQRKAMADDELREYVRAATNKEPNITKSSLLRSLRDSGRACEQKRFSRCYQEVRPRLSEGPPARRRR